MSGPYRDPDYACPACKATLRVYLERLCCDACNGMFLTVDDLQRSIVELATVPAQLHFLDGAASERTCPRCAATMTRCRLDVELQRKRPRLPPELDRCAAHGVWFDRGELTKVFELLHAAVWPRGYGAGKPLKE